MKTKQQILVIHVIQIVENVQDQLLMNVPLVLPLII